MERQISFAQFLVERGTPYLNIQDQSILSPNGRVSTRTRQRTQQDERKRLTDLAVAQAEYQRLIDSGAVIDPAGDYMPRPAQPSKHEREIERLRTQAARLRELADRGMSPVRYRKEADRLEAKATATGQGSE